MSTLGSVMNSALRSMAANQLALAVASNNIANAQNPEFTRQRLVTVPAGPGGDAWGTGMGVDIAGIQAIRDSLIESRLKRETSAKDGEETLASSLGNVEVLFNDAGDTGLLRTVTNFFNSFHTLSLDPASMNSREELRINARALVDALHARSQDLVDTGNRANASIATGVSEINRLSAQIAGVTREIKIQETASTANDLRDRRNSLVKELSHFVEVHELESGGDYQLTTKDNRLLVMNGESQTFTAADVTAATGNGSLKANVLMRDVYAPKYLNALDQFAFELAQQVNSIHSGAYNLDGGTSINFFAPLASASGAARVIDIGTEVSGDARKIAASTLPAGNDNGAALQLGNLLHSPVFSGGSIVDQYRSLVFGIGTDVATAQANLREHEAMVAQLQTRRQSISEVSVDEETVQILQFQRAFEVSARLIRTVDELLQVALGLGA